MTYKADLVIYDLDGTLTQQGRLSECFTNYASCERIAAHALSTIKASYTASRKLSKMHPVADSALDYLKHKFLSSAAHPKQDVQIIAHNPVINAVLSNNSRETWGNTVLDHIDLKGNFFTRIFNEDLGPKRLKPDPYGVHIIIDRCKEQFKDIQNVWMVGNSSNDMRAALNAASDRSDLQVTPIAMGYDSPASKFLSANNNHKGFTAGNHTELLARLYSL